MIFPFSSFEVSEDGKRQFVTDAEIFGSIVGNYCANYQDCVSSGRRTAECLDGRIPDECKKHIRYDLRRVA